MLNSEASQEDAVKVSRADPLSLCPEAGHHVAGPWVVGLHLRSHIRWVGDLSALTKESPAPAQQMVLQPSSLRLQPAAVPSIANGRLQSSDPLTWPECHTLDRWWCWVQTGPSQGPAGPHGATGRSSLGLHPWGGGQGLDL